MTESYNHESDGITRDVRALAWLALEGVDVDEQLLEAQDNPYYHRPTQEAVFFDDDPKPHKPMD